MRRFVFEDTEHDVKVTLDMSEEMFNLVKESGKEKLEALKQLILFTFEKGAENGNPTWNYDKVEAPR